MIRRGSRIDQFPNLPWISGNLFALYTIFDGYQALAWRHISGTLRYMSTGKARGWWSPSAVAKHYREVDLPRLNKQQKVLDVGLTAAGGVTGNGVAGLVAHRQGWDEATTLAARIGGSVTGAFSGFSASKLIGNVRLNLLQYRTLQTLTKKWFE
jgi:hypothetical protein